MGFGSNDPDGLMRTPTKNTRLTGRQKFEQLWHTDRNTPMGLLLRRYWWPFAGASEFDSSQTRSVRLLGEDLVAFKDLSGQFGLVQRHCPHRGANLVDGMVEACGLRCSYHGWLFSKDGECLEAPYEDIAGNHRLRSTVRVTSYPVQEMGGLLWAYLGPEPLPLLPQYEFFNWDNGFRQIVLSEIPCNWFQCQENSMDPVHFEWRHSNWSMRKSGKSQGYSAKHLKLKFEEFEYGFRYYRLREGSDETDPLWTIGRVCLWPNGLYTGNHAEFRTPVDDHNTLSIAWHFSRVPAEREPYVQKSIPTWTSPTKTPEGTWITTHVTNQDFVAWVGQGVIANRAIEKLGASDKGIALMRKRFLADLDLVSRGQNPKGVFDSGNQVPVIILPAVEREVLIKGLPLNAMLENSVYRERLRTFVFQAGQPDHVRREFIDAMGLDGLDIGQRDETVDLLSVTNERTDGKHQ